MTFILLFSLAAFMLEFALCYLGTIKVLAMQISQTKRQLFTARKLFLSQGSCIIPTNRFITKDFFLLQKKWLIINQVYNTVLHLKNI